MKTKFNISHYQSQPPIADASFRAYMRINHSQGSHILMFFPPQKEDGKRTVESSEFFLQHAVRVPKLYGYDISLGVLLQEDMGDEILLRRVQKEMSPHLYHQALVQLQLLQGLDARKFGYMDENILLNEMRLFGDWYLDKWLGIEVETSALENLYSSLINLLVEAPKCCVHYDFHSRNLVVLADTEKDKAEKMEGLSKDLMNDNLNGKDVEIGILDYQDLAQGHFCYDIWSLLRDAYITLPQDLHMEIFTAFSMGAEKKFSVSSSYIRRQYNLVGIHRCLKVCGTFARLLLRDRKKDYVGHIPRLINYMETSLKELVADKTSAGQQSDSLGNEDINFLAKLLRQISGLTAAKLDKQSNSR